MTIKMPYQMFVNGEFIDAEGGKTYKSINPTDGTVKDILTTKDFDFYQSCCCVKCEWFSLLAL